MKFVIIFMYVYAIAREREHFDEKTFNVVSL